MGGRQIPEPSAPAGLVAILQHDQNPPDSHGVEKARARERALAPKLRDLAAMDDGDEVQRVRPGRQRPPARRSRRADMGWKATPTWVSQ